VKKKREEGKGKRGERRRQAMWEKEKRKRKEKKEKGEGERSYEGWGAIRSTQPLPPSLFIFFLFFYFTKDRTGKMGHPTRPFKTRDPFSLDPDTTRTR